MGYSGGIRRDSSIATQRRLDLVRRLLRGPASAETLIADLRASLGDDIYPADARAALRHDMAALRDTFGCAFFFRAGEGYFLTDLGTLTLLDLDQGELEACALVFTAIDEGVLPHTPQLARLRQRLLKLMPEHQRAQLPTIEAGLRFEQPLHVTKADAALIARLRPALGRSEISFQYRSPYTSTDEIERHRVAPYELFQRDGATYLDAYCLQSSLAKLHGRTIAYRLDRIVPRSLRRLPTQLPPMRYARRVYRLRYELAPVVARRRDMALWFEDSSCTYADDGRAVVEACITDLWYAQTVLLRYREHCRVLHPPELVAMMRASAERMARLYTNTPGDDDLT
jgi:predicted DNA-binding transcriptional regulator YafY